MPVVFKNPEAVCRKPVVVIAIKDNVRVAGDTCLTQQFLEFFLADNIAPKLILKLCRPAKTDRTGEMLRCIKRSLDADLDQPKFRTGQVFIDPFRRYKC